MACSLLYQLIDFHSIFICIVFRISTKLSQEEREVIGRKCKRLIDLGRVYFLQEHGLKSSLKVYIEEFFTPENVVLVAS
jgi:tRNA:m4X modification enzyme